MIARFSPKHSAAALSAVALLLSAAGASGQAPAVAVAKPNADVVLFDFESPAEAAAFAPSSLHEGKAEEPAARVALTTDHASSGKHALKITFAGGRWPSVVTAKVPEDWSAFKTFRAEVFVDRPCLVGFAVMQEKSTRTRGWDGSISRWVKTQLCRTGRNEIAAAVHPPNDYAISRKLGKVVSLEIFLYNPRDGESIVVDNIRLLTAADVPVPPKPQIRVVGTDLVVADAIELGKKLKDRWKAPSKPTIEQVQAEFRDLLAELKKTHPTAVLASFRDGQTGFDPKNPERVYAGWKDAYWSSHGPDGMTIDRAENFGRHASQEIFMRHRSPLMRVDLSSIPAGSTILAAKLIVCRAGVFDAKNHNPDKPNMWVVEPCNRPWEEHEVNAYEFAKDKFWRDYGGRHFGDDPDFLPMYLAHGPSQGPVNTWDFAEAVRFWTDGKHENHGFMLHGDSHDWIRAHYRESAEPALRPGVVVIYAAK